MTQEREIAIDAFDKEEAVNEYREYPTWQLWDEWNDHNRRVFYLEAELYRLEVTVTREKHSIETLNSLTTRAESLEKNILLGWRRIERIRAALLARGEMKGQTIYVFHRDTEKDRN